MSESRLVESFAFMIGFMFISIVLFMLDGYTLSIWLGINVVLAMVPFIIITLAYKRLVKREFTFDWITWVLLIVFIFFLPNTFYIMTDMIHINSSDFYRLIEYGNADYKDFIEPYILNFHIFISSIIGVFLGVKSLIIWDRIIKAKIEDRYSRGVFFVGLLMLSSLGIYIGRFLRFFSWEVLNPFKIIPEVLESADLFMFTFVILFTFMQYLLYYGYKLVVEQEPFK